MALTTLYLDTPSFTSATVVFSDSDLLICAPDGFYSDGVIVREQVGCVLLPEQLCPSCPPQPVPVPLPTVFYYSLVRCSDSVGGFRTQQEVGDISFNEGDVVVGSGPTYYTVGPNTETGTNIGIVSFYGLACPPVPVPAPIITYNYYFAEPCDGGTTVYMRSTTAFSPGESFKFAGDSTCYVVGTDGAPVNSNDWVEAFPDCNACNPPVPQPQPVAPPPVAPVTYEYAFDVDELGGFPTNLDACGNILGVSVFSTNANLIDAVQVGEVWFDSSGWPNGFNGDFKWYGVGTTSDLDSVYAILLSNTGTVQDVYDCSTPPPVVPTPVRFFYQATNCSDGGDVITIYNDGSSLTLGTVYGNGPVIGDGCYEITSTGGSGGFNVVDFTEYVDCVSCEPPTPVPAPVTPPPVAPVPVPAPVALGCFTYSIQNNSIISESLTFQYRDCDGNLIQDNVVLADSGTPDFCAEEGSVARQSGTFSWVLTTEATTCTVVPQPVPQPVAPVPAPVPAPTNCQFVFVPNSQSTTDRGLRYNNGGEVNTPFSSLFGVPSTEGGVEGVVYGVCSSITPLWLIVSTNVTTAYPSGSYPIGTGGSCSVDFDCQWTPSPVPIPQPVAPVPVAPVPVAPVPVAPVPVPVAPVPVAVTNYRVSDCDGAGSYNMSKSGCSFSIGDVVQYVRNSNPNFVYCGTITSTTFPTGSEDASLFSCNAYGCGDFVHCDIDITPTPVPVPVPVPVAPVPQPVPQPVAPVPQPVPQPVAPQPVPVPAPTFPQPQPVPAPVAPVPVAPSPAPVPFAPVPAPVAPVPAPVVPIPAPVAPVPAPVAPIPVPVPAPVASFNYYAIDRCDGSFPNYLAVRSAAVLIVGKSVRMADGLCYEILGAGPANTDDYISQYKNCSLCPV